MKTVSALLSSLFLAGFLTAGAMAQSLDKSVTIPTNVTVAGKSLPMGRYKLKVENNTAVFMKGSKEVVSVPANLVESKNKPWNTEVQIDHSSSTPQLQRIDFSGTTEAVVFGNSGTNNASGQ